MEENHLNVVTIDKQNFLGEFSSKNSRKLELQAKFERLWLIDPEQFNPLRNCMERERLNRTEQLIKEFTNPDEQLVVDLGCGSGVFARRLTELGSIVHGLDIAMNALKQMEHIEPKLARTMQGYLPRTTLPDNGYDLVLAMDVIAYLPADEYRLFFSELSRLVKSKGYVVCSTPLDINSENPLERFARLAETEFKIEKWILSYHLLHIKFRDFFDSPSRFIKASKDIEYRHQELSRRAGWKHWWFKFNSRAIPAAFWSLIHPITTPIARMIKQNRTFMLYLEKLSHFIWDERGVTHIIFIGIRRPLVETPPEELPQETKHKKQIWE